MTAELLLKYQRCSRRTFLDTYGDLSQRDAPSDLLLKLRQDKLAHQKAVLEQYTYQQPYYSKDDWNAGAIATLELMYQGVECIYNGVLLTTYSEKVTLLSRPTLLLKQPGKSWFGDWVYIPAQIELGKRPKSEYQIVAAFHAHVLATAQGVEPDTALLLLRTKGAYTVSLSKWMPQMQRHLEELVHLEVQPAPEVFISRQRCSLCRWFNHCYAIAKSQQHLSLLPGVTPNRYTQLQALNIVTLASLAQVTPSQLENLPGFNRKVAQQIVLQAQCVVENRPLLQHNAGELTKLHQFSPLFKSAGGVEIYFDIEAQPELNLDYMLGVLVIDRQANTQTFHSLLAEKPEEEELIWQRFLTLVEQYPQAAIFHFCTYELDTVKRLAKLYNTGSERIKPLIERFIDIYELVMQTVALPVESYALKAIARWLGFEWRNPQANGSQCIYWYDQWLETGDRSLLEAIKCYNEDDCYATYYLKQWLVSFLQDSYFLTSAKNSI